MQIKKHQEDHQMYASQHNLHAAIEINVSAKHSFAIEVKIALITAMKLDAV